MFDYSFLLIIIFISPSPSFCGVNTVTLLLASYPIVFLINLSADIVGLKGDWVIAALLFDIGPIPLLSALTILKSSKLIFVVQHSGLINLLTKSNQVICKSISLFVDWSGSCIWLCPKCWGRSISHTVTIIVGRCYTIGLFACWKIHKLLTNGRILRKDEWANERINDVIKVLICRSLSSVNNFRWKIQRAWFLIINKLIFNAIGQF